MPTGDHPMPNCLIPLVYQLGPYVFEETRQGVTLKFLSARDRERRYGPDADVDITEPN